MNYDSPEYALAMRKQSKIDTLRMALADLLDITVEVPMEVRTVEHFKKLEAWRDKYKKSLQ